jgi:hypothetical protein
MSLQPWKPENLTDSLSVHPVDKFLKQFEVFTVIRVQTLVFWILTTNSLEGGLPAFRPSSSCM